MKQFADGFKTVLINSINDPVKKVLKRNLI